VEPPIPAGRQPVDRSIASSIEAMLRRLLAMLQLSPPTKLSM
jgi:hypothetical protein